MQKMNTCSQLMMPLAALLAMASTLVSCQTATPASRIEENPVMFASLPAEDQLLVQRGQIRTGMSQDAVFLAWGYPNSRPYVGEKEGRRTERWVYTRLTPVMVSPGLHAGYGHGPYGWRHRYYGMAADTAYVPQNAACVSFENGKVISWEALR